MNNKLNWDLMKNGIKTWFIELWLWILRIPRATQKTAIRWYEGTINIPKRIATKTNEMKSWTPKQWWTAISKFLVDRAILLSLIILIIVIAIMNKNFISARNISTILRNSTYRLILALGVGTIIVGKGTDLSVGRVVGFSSLVGAIFSQDITSNPYVSSLIGNSPFVIILVTMCVGMLFGAITGLIVSKLKVDPFIATLGMMLVAYGGNYLFLEKVSKGQNISGLSQKYTNFTAKPLFKMGEFGVTGSMILALAIGIMMWIMWTKTPLGKKIFAVGGNKQAAAVSGIKVGRIIFITYLIAGALYGIGAPLLTWSTGTVGVDTGVMFELDAISACIVGGLSFDGGRGKVSGVVTGVIIFESISNGFTILNLATWMIYVIKGLIIIGAIAFDMLKVRKKK